jgi:hypothetical protein
MPPGIAAARRTLVDSSARFYNAGEVRPFARKLDRLRETFAVGEKRSADVIPVNVKPNGACPFVKTP